MLFDDFLTNKLTYIDSKHVHAYMAIDTAGRIYICSAFE